MVTTARVLGVVFLSLLGTSQGLPILSEVSKVLEDVTVPAAVLIPAIKLGPDVAKRWLSSILTKAKNAATLETFSTKPFNVVVPSDSMLDVIGVFSYDLLRSVIVWILHLRVRINNCSPFRLDKCGFSREFQRWNSFWPQPLNPP